MRVIAHRGASGSQPENNLAAFRTAPEQDVFAIVRSAVSSRCSLG